MHACIRGCLIGPRFGLKAAWLLSKGLRWKHISRPVTSCCLQVIYSLPLPRETQREGEMDPGGPAAVLWRFWPPKHCCKHAVRSQMPAMLIAQQPCIVSASLHACFFFYPSHLPLLPNLYVNSLFLKQCCVHIYSFVAGTQKPTINSLLELLHGKQSKESLRFNRDLVKTLNDT